MAKTRAELEAESEARHKVFAYLAGFEWGASLYRPDKPPCDDPGQWERPEYAEGYNAGRAAKNAAKRHAEQTYGYTLAVLRPA